MPNKGITRQHLNGKQEGVWQKASELSERINSESDSQREGKGEGKGVTEILTCGWANKMEMNIIKQQWGGLSS